MQRRAISRADIFAACAGRRPVCEEADGCGPISWHRSSSFSLIQDDLSATSFKQAKSLNSGAAGAAIKDGHTQVDWRHYKRL
jgi:hypothetical protein